MPKRQSIEFASFSHANPIPGASRIGNIVMSSVISGYDPGTRDMPGELSQQITNIFTHIRNAVEAARGAAGWSAATAHNRAQVLYYLAENLAARRDELAAPLARRLAVRVVGSARRHSGRDHRRIRNRGIHGPLAATRHAALDRDAHLERLVAAQ